MNFVEKAYWFTTSGEPRVKFKTGPCEERGEQRQWQATPDWQVAGSVRKGTHIQGLS